jgi:hypothetical protein
MVSPEHQVLRGAPALPGRGPQFTSSVLERRPVHLRWPCSSSTTSRPNDATSATSARTTAAMPMTPGSPGVSASTQGEGLEGADNFAQPLDGQHSFQGRPDPSGGHEGVPHESDGQHPGTDHRHSCTRQHEDQRCVGLDVQPASRRAHAGKPPRNGTVHRVKKKSRRTQHYHRHAGRGSAEQRRNCRRRTACHQHSAKQGNSVRGRGQPGLAVEDGSRGISHHRHSGTYGGKEVCCFSTCNGQDPAPGRKEAGHGNGYVHQSTPTEQDPHMPPCAHRNNRRPVSIPGLTSEDSKSGRSSRQTGSGQTAPNRKDSSAWHSHQSSS